MYLNNRIFGAILVNIILLFKRAKSQYFYHDKFEPVSNSKICSAFDFNHEYFCSTHAVGFTDSKRQWAVSLKVAVTGFPSPLIRPLIAVCLASEQAPVFGSRLAAPFRAQPTIATSTCGKSYWNLLFVRNIHCTLAKSYNYSHRILGKIFLKSP